MARALIAPFVLAGALSAGFLSLSGLVAGPALAQDAAELTVRVNRLENQLRQLSGQIEQLSFENRRLTEQLRRFQEDVDFRLNERGGGRQGTAQPGQPAAGAATAQPPGQRPSRGDAFDPAEQPQAPGAPRQLGGSAVGPPGGIAIIDEGPGAPLDLSRQGRPLPQGALPPGQRGGGMSAAATAPTTPRQVYDAAYGYVLNREYEQAEMGFRQFLQSYPRDRLVPTATYWLGESFFRRNRHQEAAEHFLKVTTDYGRAMIAPDAMFKLGQSLAALGARDQACATFAQVAVRYPSASNNVKQGVDRERRRARCDG